MSEFESTEFHGGAAARVEREGLPPGYRMRADAHYVESLSGTPRSDRADAAARAADTTTPRPAVVDARDRRFLQQLAEELAAIESAATMLAADTSPLARRVSLDLIKAQSARAAWLVRARALDGATVEAPLRARSIGAILGDVRDRLAAECRLVGVRLEIEGAGGAAPVTVDHAALGTGVMGAVLAVLGLAAGSDDPVVRVSAEGSDDRVVAVAVSHPDATLAAGSFGRFFDVDWADRPGGWLAAMGARSAQVAAERLGGTATASPVEGRRGCAVRLSFA